MVRAQGWAVVSETATRGFMGRIGTSMRRLADELGSGPQGRRLTFVTAAGFGFTTQLPPLQQLEWREKGLRLLCLLEERRTGLLITVDEIHAADRQEIAQLAADV